MNTASRLESSCQELACQLVVSTATIEAANLPVSGGTKELISVKGREQRVAIIAFVATADKVIDSEPSKHKGHIKGTEGFFLFHTTLHLFFRTTSL